MHVGGLCALDKVPALLKLLKPEGGRLVVPSGPELLSITVSHGKARSPSASGVHAAVARRWCLRCEREDKCR